MSSRLGTGAPRFTVDGVGTTYPHLAKGGRIERWAEELEEGWHNLDGDYIPGALAFRFEAEYRWDGSVLSDTQITNLIRWYNQQQTLVLKPYSDGGTYSVPVRIVNLDLDPGAVLASGEVVTLKLAGVSRVAAIPIPDNYILAGPLPLKGVPVTV